MKECIFTIDKIDRKKVLSTLGYGDSNSPSGQLMIQLNALINRVPKDVRAVYLVEDISSRDNGLVLTAKGPIASPAFGELAISADSVVFALITAGPEIDGLLQDCVDMVDAMVLDAIGSVIVEQGVDRLRTELSEVLGKNISLPFSPGYCDYPLVEQKHIFSQLGSCPLGITYHPDSFMMSPVKTISCILAAGDGPLETNPCSLCRLEKCQMRRNTVTKIDEVEI